MRSPYSLYTVLAICLFLQGPARCNAQDREYIQRSAIGIHLIADHFSQGDSIHLPGSKDRITLGLAISYLKGFTPDWDLHTTLALSFPQLTNKNGRRAFGELDLSIRRKLAAASNHIIPFVQAGLGVATYDGHYSLLAPAGAGLQATLFNETFILVQAQYRIGAAQWLPDHFYYSVGIAGIIGKKKMIVRNKTPKPMLPVDNNNSQNTGIISSVNKDRDGDGIADSVDACPDIPGDMALNGCPVHDTGTAQMIALPEISRKLKEDARNIFFETDKYLLLPASYKGLDEAVEILHAYPLLNLHIEGHTDSTGRLKANQQLSQRRAEAVLDYLVKKGIEKRRLTARGYGSTRPVADNTTPSGKALNRRVEMIPVQP